MAESSKLAKATIPITEAIAEASGKITRVWQDFFRKLQIIVDAFGEERFFDLSNNNGTPTEIKGMCFDSGLVSYVAIEYLIQRFTLTNESVSCGVMYLYYKPSAQAWEFLVAPISAGITFSVSADGQVKYTSSNITGTIVISRVVWRAKTMAGKHSTYSIAGR